MTGIDLFTEPRRWIRQAAHLQPHLWYPVVLGVGVVALAGVFYPLRKAYLYPDAAHIPFSYPLPEKRVPLKGYEDEE